MGPLGVVYVVMGQHVAICNLGKTKSQISRLCMEGEAGRAVRMAMNTSDRQLSIAEGGICQKMPR